MEQIKTPVRMQDGILTAANNRPLAPLHSIDPMVGNLIVAAINNASEMVNLLTLGKLALAVTTKEIEELRIKVDVQEVLLEVAKVITDGLIKENDKLTKQQH